MAAPNLVPYSNEYVFGRGRPLLDLLVGDEYQGFVPFGNCPGFEINVEGEQYEHTNSEGGIAEVDLTVPLNLTRQITITCDNLNARNIALFLAGSVSTVTQSSTPVTDELIPKVNAGSMYQLGAKSNNPSGVRDVSAVTVKIKEGDDAAARQDSTAYTVGQTYKPATPNDHWYICTVSGTSDGTPPSFKTDGTTFTDGTATFKDMGLVTVASTTDVNYRLDAERALLSITEDGSIAAANAAYAAVVPGGKLSLLVGYTPAANVRTQVTTGDSISLRGRLKFLADNPYGENRDLFCADVTITPSGSLPMITEGEVGSATFTIGINKLNSTTPAMIIDGVARDA
jgi:hypothetical protein